MATVMVGTSSGKDAQLLVALPDYCNTPDGMALLKDKSIIVSVPNFNDETKPPLLMRITPASRAPGVPYLLARTRGDFEGDLIRHVAGGGRR